MVKLEKIQINLIFITCLTFVFEAVLYWGISVAGVNISLSKILLLISFIFFILVIVVNNKMSKKTMNDLLFIFIVTYAFLSITWSTEKSIAVFGFINILIAYCLYYFGQNLKENHKIVLLLKIVLILALFLAVVEEITGFRFKMNTQSTFSNEILSAFFNPSFFGSTILLCMIYLLSTNSFKNKSISIIIQILVIYFVIQTGSKGILISTILYYLSCFLLNVNNIKEFIKNLLTITILTFISIYIFSTNLIPEIIKIKIGELKFIFNPLYWSERSNSFGSRNGVWEIAIDLFNENPIFGYGIGTSTNLLLGLDQNSHVLAFHNWLAQLSVELGLIGLIVFITIIINTYIQLRTNGLRNTYLIFIIVSIPISLTVGNMNILWVWWILLGGFNKFDQSKK